MDAVFVRQLFEDNLKVDYLAGKYSKNILTYAQAYNYSAAVQKVLLRTLTTAEAGGYLITSSTAEELIRPLLDRDFMLITDAAMVAQKAMNDAIGIGIKPIRGFSDNKIDEIVELVKSTPSEKVLNAIEQPVNTFGRQMVAHTQRENLNFQGKAGMKMVCVRTNDKKGLHSGKDECEYCNQWAGTWTYPDIPDEVWGFHDGCGCKLDYFNKSGKKEVIK